MSANLTPTQQEVLGRLDATAYRVIYEIADGVVGLVSRSGSGPGVSQANAVAALRALKRKGLVENRPSERVPGNMEWRRTNA